MLKKTVLLVLLLASALAWSESKQKQATKPSDPPAAPATAPPDVKAAPPEGANDRLQVSFGLGVPVYQLSIEGSGDELQLEPNLNTLSSLGASIEGFSFGWSFRNPVSGDDKINKGSSSFDDYWFGYSFHAVRIDVFYADFKGFYIDSGDQNASAQKTLLPDLKTEMYGADVSWILDPDQFSLRSAIDVAERPKTSGGSWLLGASYVNTVIRDGDGIFPTSLQSRMGEDATMQSARFQALSVTGGYGYTWKFGEKWMLSLAGQLGPGFQKASISLANDAYSQTRMNMKYDAWISGGWHGDDWFTGIKMLIDGTRFQTKALTVGSQLLEGNIFVGHYF